MTNYNDRHRIPFRKPKRRIMRRFRMDEISAVDVPAQKDATARLMKSRGEQRMSAHAPPRQQIVMAAKEAIAGIIAKAKKAVELDGDEEARERLRALRAKEEEAEDEHESEMTPERASEILEPYADHSVPPEEDTESDLLYARLGGEEEEKADEQDDEVDEEAALRHEVRMSRKQLAEDGEDEEFDESTEHGRIANALRRRDPSISKARAALMATGRRAAAAGIYAKVATRATTYGKVASRITTDAHEPFHQPSAASRRAEMDRTARAHRSSVNAEIAAMRGAFGREAEERRRTIDKMVVKLREVDRNMPHTVALQKIRRQYPGLF